MPQIEGVVEEVVYRNEANGWTVLSLRDGRERFAAVGAMGPVSPGERLRLSGEWTEHRDYGRQLRVSASESVEPSTKSGIERYLGSGLIRGVGPATAKMIVDHFGKETLEILDMDPGRLTEIDGIGPKRAAMIEGSYREQRLERQTMVFLQGGGLSPAVSARVIRTFGEKTMQIVRANPYLLAERVEGVGFRTADAMARGMGVEVESPKRIGCALNFLVNEAVNSEGHAFLPRELLLARAAQLLGVGRELISRELAALGMSGEMVLRDAAGERAVYASRLDRAEEEVARRLDRLKRTARPLTETDAEQAMDQFREISGAQLCAAQREAVLAVARGALTILTGGPGTGKTTCIRCMLSALSGKKVLLCAPTGRAAKRMSEAAGRDASTIHRLLEYSGEAERFQRDEDDPLDADCVIVDEMSMVDLFLMQALLRALKDGTRLVMVGDADQLPSVGAGNVLGDLIDSGAIEVVRLTEIFRQGAGSLIVTNAHRINRGEMPVVNQKGGDFFFERCQDAERAARSVVQLVASRLPGYLKADPIRDIQVMTPMKKGGAGVYRLNELLQAALNPPAPNKPELRRGEEIFRLGDKVMQIKNDYELCWEKQGEEGQGVYNGDIGRIEAIDTQERELSVRFDDERLARYAEEDMEQLTIAYCMSVHKSQGSEFEAVVLPLVSGPPMLMTRNLLYTAVTRAKRLAVIAGREDCVAGMIANNLIRRRYSALSERVASAMGGSDTRNREPSPSRLVTSK